MKKWLIGAVVLLLALGSFVAVRTNQKTIDSVPQPAPWPTPTSAVDYLTPPSSVYTFMCELSDEQKPTTIFSACADGNAGIGKITWQSWSAKGAAGVGYMYSNPCNPDCASDSIKFQDKVFLKLDTPIQMGKKVYLSVLHSSYADADGKISNPPLWGDWDLGYDYRMALNWGR